MTFIVIAPDEAGTLRIDDRPPTYEIVRAEASGDYGADRVQPRHEFGMAGWVHGNGLQEGLPRNIVGSMVMAALGYGPYPLAGPLVVTGYDQPGGGHIRSIASNELAGVLGAYVGILESLDLAVPDEAAQYRRPELSDPVSRESFRMVAAALYAAGTPHMTSRPIW